MKIVAAATGGSRVPAGTGDPDATGEGATSHGGATPVTGNDGSAATASPGDMPDLGGPGAAAVGLGHIPEGAARPEGSAARTPPRGAAAPPSRSGGPAGLLLIGLAGLGAGGALAWRGGLRGRLRGPGVDPDAGDRTTGMSDPAPDDAGESIALARLSVVGGPDHGGS